MSVKVTASGLGVWGVVALLGLSSCGQPTPEPVGSGQKHVGETISSSKPASPPDPTSVASAPQATRGTVPTTDQEPHERQAAEAAQWQQWYANARESPEVSVRLQALEQWAQRPGDSLDPVTYGLVDQDDAVRERAQALWDQQLLRDRADAP